MAAKHKYIYPSGGNGLGNKPGVTFREKLAAELVRGSIAKHDLYHICDEEDLEYLDKLLDGAIFVADRLAGKLDNSK